MFKELDHVLMSNSEDEKLCETIDDPENRRIKEMIADVVEEFKKESFRAKSVKIMKLTCCKYLSTDSWDCYCEIAKILCCDPVKFIF